MFQQWPLNVAMLPVGPVYPFDNGPNGICTVVQGNLFSSMGAALRIDGATYLGINASKKSEVFKWGVGVANFDRKLLPQIDDGSGDGHITIQATTSYDSTNVEHPWNGVVLGEKAVLNIHLSAHDTLKKAVEAHLKHVRRTSGRGVQRMYSMMKRPIWSTWARYKAEVTQDDVLQFANDIHERRLSRSVMSIDDRWSTEYGDFKFDTTKFPDPKAMVDELHKLNFNVMLWVTPFASLSSDLVKNHPEYFVKTETEDGSIGHVKWWQPTPAAALDLTNPSAIQHFCGALDNLRKQYGIDGFKFDAGEPCFLPSKPCFHAKLSDPSDYTRLWIHKIASRYPLSEVRSAVSGCQNMTPMLRLFDKFSNWSLANGLKSVITATLTLGMLGYPFVIPDYIGGNAYGDDLPDATLMIRWTQLSVAFPSLQFSIPPWQFGRECEVLCKTALKWRERYFWPAIESTLEDAYESYIPIIRPMFWHSPDSEVDHIHDQFMIGDNIVVAPMLQTTERKVYLPNVSTWKRVNLELGEPDGDEIKGGWRIAKAEIHDMPVFERVKA